MPVDVQTWRIRTGMFNAGRLSVIRARYQRPPRTVETLKCPGSNVPSGFRPLIACWWMVVSVLFGVVRGKIGVSDALGIVRVRCGSSKGVSSVKVVNIVSAAAAAFLFCLALAVGLLLLRAGDVERNPGPNGDVLTMEDLPVLMTKLTEIAGRWNPLGVQLKFSPGTLNGFPVAIQGDPILALQELLIHWLQRKNPPPTLETLSQVIGGPVIANESLADTLLQERAGFPSVQAREAAKNSPLTALPQACIEVPTTKQEGCESLQAEVELFESRFEDLVNETLQTVKNNVDVDNFCNGITLLPMSLKAEHVEFLRKEERLQKATDHRQIFWLLNLYWSFLNPSLLAHIVKKFGSEETKQRMQTYESDLQWFRKSTPLKVFCEVCPMVHKDIPPDFKTLVSKHEWSGCNLEDVEVFRKKFARNYSLPDCAMMLSELVEGSVSITWFVPSAVAKSLTDQIQQRNIQLLEEGRVLLLTIDNVTVFDASKFAKIPSVPKQLQLEERAEAHSEGYQEPEELPFMERFEQRYGSVHPEFFPGSLADAGLGATAAAADNGNSKPMFIYLHRDDGVVDTVSTFCKQVLCHEQVVTYLSANFVSWGWDFTYHFEEQKEKLLVMVQDCLGHSARSLVNIQLKPESLPMIVLVGDVNGSMTIRNVLQGQTDVNALMATLISTVEDTHTVEVLQNPQEIVQAAKTGNLMKVFTLLSQGVHVDTRTKIGETPLIFASWKGHLDVVRLLIDHCADIHAQDEDGFNSIMLACQDNHENVVKFLLEHDAEVNSQNKEGTTPLLWACEKGYVAIAKLLLDHHADVNVRTQNGVSPLNYACEHGYTEIVRMLLQHNADVEARNKDGTTPLLWACQEGYVEIAKLLLDHHADVNVRTQDGMTPLLWACHKGYVEIAKLLLDHHADVNVRTQNGVGPLNYACERGYTEIVRMLLQHNADVEARNKEGTTPLLWACEKGYVAIAKLLLDHHADVNVRSQDGMTPLLWACHKGYVEIAKLLLDHHADVNVRTQKGYTPLIMASQNGHTAVVEMLLKHQADVNAQNQKGTTPLIMASQNGHTAVVEMLLKHHADVNAQNQNGHTAVFLAVYWGHPSVVEALLQSGVDPNQLTKKGFTVLTFACKEPTVEQQKEGVTKETLSEAAEILLKYKAAVNVPEPSTGWTPLFFAAKDRDLKLVRLLLHYGADPTVVDKQGVTTVDLAQNEGHTSICAELTAQLQTEHKEESDETQTQQAEGSDTQTQQAQGGDHETQCTEDDHTQQAVDEGDGTNTQHTEGDQTKRYLPALGERYTEKTIKERIQKTGVFLRALFKNIEKTLLKGKTEKEQRLDSSEVIPYPRYPQRKGVQDPHEIGGEDNRDITLHAD